MKPQLRLATSVAVALAIGFGIGIAAGIATGQGGALDPLRAAPHIFRLELENASVRVLRVTERNGETAPLHSHPDRLLVYLSPCAWMVRAEDGDYMESYKLGDVVWAERTTHGGETSRVVQECSRLDIELK